jgi:catechol 2,3-dioxygenase-like lactoylglutathione lyase family enzyme/predicted enzyme related to lactoylglutathione lyase
MAVLGALSFTLEVPDIKPGVKFYADAGLIASVEGQIAQFHCVGQDRNSITLLGGAPTKRLHHISLRADRLDEMAVAVPKAGGKIVSPPDGFDSVGLWVVDPHGMRIHLSERPADVELVRTIPFEINAPGRVIRENRSAMLPSATYGAVLPLRLGHILVFTPDVLASVAFMTDGLGMGLADLAQDVIAFTCARKDSDHHVVAFAKSTDIGFHHGSFQVSDPDAVGRAGRALLATTEGASFGGDWGFGRHTIGSNFFHYIQDPWGSWFEYYSDMDYIADHAVWTPTNYAMEDSLANWGPPVPHDFVHNYEAAEILV